MMMGIMGRGSMLQVLGLSLGLGLMAPACSSESSEHDSGYYPTLDGGSGGSDGGIHPNDGGHGGGIDGGGSDAGGDAGSLPFYVLRANVGPLGTQANGESRVAVVSGTGRYVGFESDAANLVDDDTNSARDVFVHDRLAGSTSRTSLDQSNTQLNGASYSPSITEDGQLIAFVSDASNFFGGQSAGFSDVFVRNRTAGSTVWIHNALENNGHSFTPSIWGTPSFFSVGFISEASNLTSPDENSQRDAFVYASTPSGTDIFNFSQSGNAVSSAPSVSHQKLVYASDASNLGEIADTNGVRDVFFYNPAYPWPQIISISTGGALGNGPSDYPVLSANGSFAAFQSSASNLVGGDGNGASDIFVRDLSAYTTERVSIDSDGAQANGSSRYASISADGRYVAFESDATNLVLGDTNGVADIFVHDRLSGRTVRASISGGGDQANGPSRRPSISSNGHYVVFESSATNLVPGDTNVHTDIFIVGLDELFSI